MLKNKKKGFTLVELLVVISIIALLLAVLMPSLKKARGQAIAVICGARLRQLGIAYALYKAENNNKGPLGFTYGYGGRNAWCIKTTPWPYTPYQGWFSSRIGLRDYLGMEGVKNIGVNKKKMTYCPSGKWTVHEAGYSVNQFFGFEAYLGYKVKRPQDTPMLMCGKGGDIYPKQNPVDNPDTLYYVFHTDNLGSFRMNLVFESMARRSHEDAANYLFFDGHVEKVKWLGSLNAYRNRWAWTEGKY